MQIIDLSSCAMATISKNLKDVSINWNCVDKYVAKPNAPANLQWYAVMLKAVHEGTYKDVTP